MYFRTEIEPCIVMGDMTIFLNQFSFILYSGPDDLAEL